MHRDLGSPRPSIRWTSIAATSAALGALTAGGVAHAESADAVVLFNDGNQRMAEGKLAEACDAFEASNRADPRAGTLLHLGVCRERNHQLAAAWSAYKDALTRAKDPVKRDVAAARVAAIEPRLSYLTVAIPEPSRLHGLAVTRNGAAFDPSLWDRPLPVDGGDYAIAVHAPDHEDWQVIVHVAVEGARLSISIPRLNERPGPDAAPAQPAAASSPSGLTTRRKLAIGAAGMAVAGGAAGVTLGLLASRNESDASRACPSPAQPCTGYVGANTAIRSSYREAFAANVAYGIAAAAALGAGALWFTGAPDADDAPRVRVVPSLAPSQPGIVVMGRF